MLLTLPEGFGFEIEMAPSRALDAQAYPSGGAGMVGDADDVLQLVETLRTGKEGILQPATAALMRQAHVGSHAETQGPGWGFGFGGAVLETGSWRRHLSIMALCCGAVSMATVGFTIRKRRSAWWH
jgi:CubicO group peptidase (beta-lactamase class C family)